MSGVRSKIVLVSLAMALLTGLFALPVGAQDAVGTFADLTVEERQLVDQTMVCPGIAGYETYSDDPADLRENLADFFFQCQYKLTDAPGLGTAIQVNWSRPGSFRFCGTGGTSSNNYVDGNVFGADLATPVSVSVYWRASLDSGIEDSVEQAAVTLRASAATLAGECAPEPVAVSCPNIAGYGIPEANASNGQDHYAASCYYFEGEGPTIDVTLGWTLDPVSSPLMDTIFCSTETTFVNGSGQVGLDNQAGFVRYIIDARSAIDLAPVDAMVADLAGQIATQAKSCDGVPVFVREDQFTPIPAYLASAFGPEVVAAPGPPPFDASSAPSAEPATALPSADDEPAPNSDNARTETGDLTVAADPSGKATLFKILSILMMVFSAVGLVLAFLFIRQPSRVRPRLDIFRIAVIALVAIVSMMVFSRRAPLWAVALAVLVGGGLGLAQGRNLVLSQRSKGLYGQRSAWAVGAFAAGLLLTQFAGIAQRTGLVQWGVALSFFSAATAAGLYAGRHPQVLAARASSAVGVLVLAVMLVAAVGAGASRVEAQDDVRDAEIQDYLIGIVDWENVDLNGGLFARDLYGKPMVAITIPDAMLEPPAPVSRTVEWVAPKSNLVVEGTSYLVAETFTFSLRADGVCCSVDYDGTATESVPRDGEIEVSNSHLAGSLGDIQSVMLEGAATDDWAGRFGDHLMPFDMAQNFVTPVGQDSVCGRSVSQMRNQDVLEETGAAISLIDQNTGEELIDTFEIGVRMTIPCEQPGFTLEDALALAPPVPATSGGFQCPTTQEAYGAFQAANSFTGTHLATAEELFFEPNVENCVIGALIDPPSFGQGGRGGTRHELVIDFAQPRTGEWDRGYNRWFTDDRVLTLATPNLDDESQRCAPGPDGIPERPADDETCVARSVHRLDENHIMSIFVDYSYFDGPNTTIDVQAPWGTYKYRCHHCDPDDPALVEMVAGINQFGVDWANEQYGDGVVGTTNLPDQDENSGTQDLAANETSSDEIDGANAPSDGQTDDGFEGEAALAAAVGLLGTAALAGSLALESGDSIAEGLRSLQRGSGGRGIIDEFGTTLYPDEDGLYEWDDGDTVSRVSADDLSERIAREQAARTANDARATGRVAAQQSDEAADARSVGLSDRTQERDDEIRAGVRAGREAMAEAEAYGARRDAAEVALASAEAAQADATDTSWGSIRDDAFDGMLRDVESLPGYVRDAGAATRVVLDQVVDAATDPENWRILAETAAETIWDTAGVMSGGGFGDGAQSVADGVRGTASTVAHVGQAVASEAWRDPIGFIASVTPLQDFADAVDGDKPLGDRLAALGRGLVDVGMTLSGAAAVDAALDVSRAADTAMDVARVTDTATDAARAADTVGDAARAADTATDAARAAEAADTATDAARAVEAVDDVGDAARAVEAVDDVGDAARAGSLMDPDVADGLNRQVREAVASGDKDALRQVYRDGGMERLGELERAGVIDQDLAEELLQFHDEVTGAAVHNGTLDTIGEFESTWDIRPTEVLVGNSGSTGELRSVLTDADRTMSVSWAQDDIEHYAERWGLSDSETSDRLTQSFTNRHQRNVELRLNPADDVAVLFARENNVDLGEAIETLQREGRDSAEQAAQRLTRGDMDTASYSGFRGGGPNADEYPMGYTRSRQSIQGTTEVYRPDDFGVSNYSASGQTIIDHDQLEQARWAGGELPRADGWPVDPNRISSKELGPLLDQQRQAAQHYDDAKSISKAVDRAQYVASRSGQPMADASLVQAAVAMRADPRSATAVLAELGMTEAEFVAEARTMLSNYNPGL